MKKISLLLFLVLIFPYLVLATYAHPGSLDAYGGHWDHSNGTYHFHDGTNTGSSSITATDKDYKYHYDDGYADGYEKGRKEGYQSGDSDGYESGWKEGYNQGYNKAVEEYSAQLASVKKDNEGKISWLWLLALGVICALIILSKNQELDSTQKDVYYWQSQSKDKDNNIKSLSGQLSTQKETYELKIAQERRNVELLSGMHCWDFHCELKKFYGDRYMYDMAGAPPDAYLDKQYLPHTKGGVDRYTFYLGTSKSGFKKFHKSNCIYAVHSLPINAYEIYHGYNSYKIERCKVCNPTLPTIEWVDKLKDLYQFINKYEKPIDVEPEPQLLQNIRYSLCEKTTE